ncbi:MAG: hypothetical protein HQL71_11785 [Magnetococcales bacterium]|nr:hypothetical protein [Magnetococcales bacterium]
MILPADDYHSTSLPKMRQVSSGLDSIATNVTGRWAVRKSQVNVLMERSKSIVDSALKLHTLTDEELTKQLRDIASKFRLGKPSDEIYDSSLAILSEASRRSMGMQPYPVQVMGVLTLSLGFLAEMATGEGKSLTAGLSAILAGWSGRPCHVLTANDYLAQRDAQELIPLFNMCGVSVGWVTEEMQPQERSAQYEKQVVYTTSKELLGDFLRDRIKLGQNVAVGQRLIQRLIHWPKQPGEDLVLKGLHTAIIDEADSILIDEAVTPFIIAAPRDNKVLVEAVKTTNELVKHLIKDKDYRVIKRLGVIQITDEGRKRLESLASDLPGMWRGRERRQELVQHALRAREMYEKDKHFVILDDKIVLVDERTGRLTPNRSLGIGLHQALEAYVGVELSPPTETMARFSYQKFFRLFPFLCGMSGTIEESSSELWSMFGLPVLAVPPHRTPQRIQLPAQPYIDQNSKWQGVVEAVIEVHKTGRPILLGTRDVDSSELLAEKIRSHGLECELLNAVHHQNEASIVLDAGHKNRITIATNMAGRGTDIKLTNDVKKMGGLCVIATEPNESQRVDRQLYGRCGRQGDPGSAQLFFSLDDPIFKLFLPKFILFFLVSYFSISLPRKENLARKVLDWVQNKAEKKGFKQRVQILSTDKWLEDSMTFSKE